MTEDGMDKKVFDGWRCNANAVTSLTFADDEPELVYGLCDDAQRKRCCESGSAECYCCRKVRITVEEAPNE